MKAALKEAEANKQPPQVMADDQARGGYQGGYRGRGNDRGNGRGNGRGAYQGQPRDYSEFDYSNWPNLPIERVALPGSEEKHERKVPKKHWTPEDVIKAIKKFPWSKKHRGYVFPNGSVYRFTK